MAIASIALSLALVWLDHRLEESSWQDAWWLYGGGSQGARGVLSVVAGSMITVAGVVFSIMMVVLSLAAQQYGPRLLRNFLRDRITQLVLGTFVATFLYCLMVLRTVRGEDHGVFVPQISVTTGLGLAVISLGVLIYFIHHVSVSIHISQIITQVQRELLNAIDTMFPETLGKDVKEVDDAPGDARLPADFEEGALPIKATSAGYLQAIEDKELIELTHEHDVVVKLVVQPGDYVLRNQTLMFVWPGNRLDDETGGRFRKMCLIGDQRTPFQDIRFAVAQQTDIAIRALSPGINDPYTANSCLEHLAEALAALAERQMPSHLRYHENRLRIVAIPVVFTSIVQLTLGHVRQYARTAAPVTLMIINVIDRLAPRLRREADRDGLLAQIDAIEADDYHGLAAGEIAQIRTAAQMVRSHLSQVTADGSNASDDPVQ
jgi:uncharacterized membrane protein